MKSQGFAGAVERAARFHEVRHSIHKRVRTRPRQGRVITISRLFGAGGISVSRLLGNRLNWPVWDREILDLLAQCAGGECDTALLHSVDERIQSVFESMLTSFCQHFDYQNYLCLLPKVIRQIAMQDAIILGRGAHLVCSNALRVFLKASEDQRIRNIASRFAVSICDAKKMMQQRDSERATFIRAFARRLGFRDIDRQHLFDLEINTDLLSFDQVVDLILSAVQARFAGTEFVN